MKTLAVLLAMTVLPTVAHADMLERQAARFIRNAGHWCDRVSDMRVDKRKTTQDRRVVLVTCYDVRHFAQYELVLGRDNEVTSIKKM